MRGFYRRILVQLLIFVSLALLLFHLLLKSKAKINDHKYGYEFEPKIPVQLGSWLEQSVRADLSRQRVHLRKLDAAASVGNQFDLREHGLNIELSNRLSYIRNLPDVRHELCKQLERNNTHHLRASIIIIFHNVPFSVLLRTVHSVIRRSDSYLLKDLVLVDDASSYPDLNEKLEYYVNTRFQNDVKLLRNKKRLGSSASRVKAAKYATGEALIFMDPYSEPNEGWLPPLLMRLVESPTSVVMPVHDDIDAHYFTYKAKPITVGGFSWSGLYYDQVVSKSHLANLGPSCNQPLPTCPIRTPTMSPRSVYGISRKFYDDMIYFDDTLVSGGGDSLDMSFSTWLCFGMIEILPCSHVGRISMHESFKRLYKSRTADRGKVAISWWGTYNNLFFYYHPQLSPNLFTTVKLKRDTVREFLNCKNMGWYLENVYPEKLLPSSMVNVFGRLKTRHGNYCLSDRLMAHARSATSLLVVDCDKSQSPENIFFYTKTHQLRSEFHCLVVDPQSPSPQLVQLVPCIDIPSHYLTNWTLHQNFISMYFQSGTFCLDQIEIEDRRPVIQRCDHKRHTQHWSIRVSPTTTTTTTTNTTTRTVKKLATVVTKKKTTDKKQKQLKATKRPIPNKPQAKVFKKVGVKHKLAKRKTTTTNSKLSTKTQNLTTKKSNIVNKKPINLKVEKPKAKTIKSKTIAREPIRKLWKKKLQQNPKKIDKKKKKKIKTAQALKMGAKANKKKEAKSKTL